MTKKSTKLKNPTAVKIKAEVDKFLKPNTYNKTKLLWEKDSAEKVATTIAKNLTTQLEKYEPKKRTAQLNEVLDLLYAIVLDELKASKKSKAD